MNDKHREKLLEEYEEITMELLMDEYAEAEGEMLWNEFQAAEEDGEVPDIPDDLDQKCRNVIRSASTKINRRVRFTQGLRALSKVAVFTLVLFGVCSTLVLSVDALRIPVLNFFLRDSDRYTVVALDEENQTIQEEFDNIKNRIEYLIPDGYDLALDEMSDYGSLQLAYHGSNDEIITLVVAPASGQLVMDTEDAEIKKMEVNELDALFVDKDGLHIVWMNPESSLSYDLFASSLDSALFWKIVYALAS